MHVGAASSIGLFLFLAACGSGGGDTSEGHACLTVEPAQACPSSDDAARELVGTTTCAEPHLEVTGIGELLTDAVELRDHDNTVLGTDDTGAPFEVRECCYEATYAPAEGTCVI